MKAPVNASAGSLAGRRIAVVGTGKMGATLLRGLLDRKLVEAEQVIATALHEDRLRTIDRELGVPTSRDNRAAVAGAEIVLLCVKPQVAAAVLEELRDVLTPDHLVVSILASVSTRYIEERLSPGVPVVRAMPNTPCLIGAGMTALCSGHAAQVGHLELTEQIFNGLGRVLTLDEKHFDAVTSLSASGPAFLYIVIEALAEGGVKAGLPRAVATELAAQACLGSARMVLETGSHPAVLKDAVTTPAGCTIDGILRLEEGGLRVTLIKTITEAAKRAGELVE